MDYDIIIYLVENIYDKCFLILFLYRLYDQAFNFFQVPIYFIIT